MKCNAYIRRTTRKYKGQIVPDKVDVIPEWMTLPHKSLWCTPERLIADGYTERCDGRIVAHVDADEEPYYGGTSARFVGGFRCEKCGNSHFPFLPPENDAVAFTNMLNAFLDGLTEDQIEAMRQKRIADEVTEQESWARARAEFVNHAAIRAEKRRQRALKAAATRRRNTAEQNLLTSDTSESK